MNYPPIGPTGNQPIGSSFRAMTLQAEYRFDQHMIASFASLLIAFAMSGSSGAEPSEPEGPPRPICVHASHDRLVTKKGRDVCAPALDAAGKARAVGLMPTVCERPEDKLMEDAIGEKDVCEAKQAASTKTGDKT